MQTISISLPENLYRRLQYAAEISGRSIGELAVQSVEENLPPLLEALPAHYRDELKELEECNDDGLWSIARYRRDEKQNRLHQRLLRKNAEKSLTDTERKQLTDLRLSADRMLLRKAFALLLLKLRGHRLPVPTELESTQ